MTTEFNLIYPEEIYSISQPPTIIIGVPWNELADPHRMLLSKILSSVRCSLESIRIIHSNQFDISSWAHKPSRIIAFVNPPKGVAAYELIQTGETSMVFSDPLEILNSDEAAKRKLWTSLRLLFQA